MVPKWTSMCILVPNIAQTEDKDLHLTRKGFHAIKMQGTCDSQHILINVVIRWPGSSHDAFLRNNWEIAQRLEERHYGDRWFLGDSAYPLNIYLLTPVMDPATQAQIQNNVAHKRTRCVVERAYGLWMMRFRCCILMYIRHIYCVSSHLLKAKDSATRQHWRRHQRWRRWWCWW